MKISKAQFYSLLLLLVLAFFLRAYKIDEVPASLYYDEIDYGYQARSLIKTGKDYRGSLSPFFVHSFNDIRAPLPAYLTVLTTLLFKQPELQVRMPFVISGTLSVALIFLLALLWTKNFTVSFITAFVFTISPWQIQFSRFSHEVMIMQLFYLSALVLFYFFLKRKKYRTFLFSVILFSLCLYTYRTMSFYIPVTMIILTLLYHKEIFRLGLQKILIALILIAVIVLPFLYFTTIKAPDIPRINQLAIVSDPTVPIWVQRNREVDSGDFTDATLGKKAAWFSYVFHNKPLSWGYSFFNNYFQSFSTDFLFIRGDPNPRHSVGGMGELYFIDALALIFGLFYLIKNLKAREFRFLLIWFLTALVAAALTSDGARHAARLFIFSTPLLVITGLGWWSIFKIAGKIKFAKLIIFFLGVILASQFILYYHRYLTHYPIESAGHFGYGFKQAMLKISRLEKDYKKVILVPDYEPPMIYYLFWSNTHPKFLQEYGGNFSTDLIKGKKLDKYKVVGWSTEKGKEYDMFETLEPNVLYLITKQQLPKDLREGAAPPRGVRLLDLITYPDKEVAFYLIDRDPNYKP